MTPPENPAPQGTGRSAIAKTVRRWMTSRRRAFSLNGALVSCSLGIILASQRPYLPPPFVLGLLVPLILGLFWRAPRWRQCLAFGLLGFLWGASFGHWQLYHRLPQSFGGAEIRVQGILVGLPDHDARRERIRLQVERVESTTGSPLDLPLRHILVSWYGGPSLHAGERWQLTLRVRPPRGFVNPGGLDYQLWLMRQGVDATAYVRESADNRRLAAPSAQSLSYWRERVRHWLEGRHGLVHRDLMQALLIGDRSGLSPERWAQLLRSGTNHLLAISGLHVGMVALAGLWCGGVLGRGLNVLCHRVPASASGQVLALLCALLYSALAGFSIPTQRALIMIGVVQWMTLCRRTLPAPTGLLLAWLAVLLRDPLAPFDPGFWLSFTAVAVLVLAFTGRRRPSGRQRGGGVVTSQWAVFLGLLVPLLILMHGVSLLAPIANVLAIPLVTLMVVPWLLLALALSVVWPWASEMALTVADVGLSALLTWLGWLEALAPMALFQAVLSGPALALAGLAALLTLLPRGMPGRWLGYPGLLLALLLPGPPVPPLRVAFLDVGQGLAVAVQTPDYRLVYDTGPTYSERLDAGSGVIVPYWRQLGVHQLDAVVVSHRHDDHAGGLSSVLSSLPTETLWVGDPELPAPMPGKECHQGASWQWNQVSFRFLHGGFPARMNDNNRSCVLEIEYAGQRILLTGDIEREVEWRLIGRDQLRGPVDVLQVPHHGATTSSSVEWVARTRPSTAVISAAYRGRHGHPDQAVVERYRARDAEVLNTATLGAIVFEWDKQGRRRERYARQAPRRWWYE
ncbi:DNA internalization-related competence protein ComEC/Rec2 [Marinimicrobium sp. C6131]|uniref:DNA internalization-related competence protein ComEC/Rec2 n=1 Tax=Marinimicrobium sp. C6131 TaxID=3022676 RepID=UPI002AC85FC5|nr:DNA internalization-related competence protein ComEC/Rec2 [Marinimicrobium sp. C6131]